MRIKIRQYMRQVLEEHRNPLTNEINCTGLAEDAADEFDLYDENDDPRERLFELALEIAEIDERQRLGLLPRNLGGLVVDNDDCLRE